MAETLKWKPVASIKVLQMSNYYCPKCRDEFGVYPIPEGFMEFQHSIEGPCEDSGKKFRLSSEAFLVRLPAEYGT